ncbi:MAG: P1 family peptidase [Candidatus Levybacteria bacterium]|nr:P1 family peptidase [Candidatus Levybacteria bacterium]
MDKESLRRVGIKIGHYTDRENLTGLTVFIAEKGADIGIDVKGSSTGSHNTEAYGNPKAATRLAQAIVLTGGSSYGLESIFGVMEYLEKQGIGNKTKAGIVPGITGGVIYDLTVGSAKVRPTKENGYKAAENSSYNIPREGNVGVGTGATTGKWFDGKHLKGGFGIAEVHLPQDILVCAFVVTNSSGDIVNPKTGKFYYDEGNFDLGKHHLPDNLEGFTQSSSIPLNTTLAVIATNMAMNRNQLLKVAEIAQDGMARSILPVHATYDGDIVFATSSHSGERRNIPGVADTIVTDVVGLGAADALAKAIKSSILHAEDIDDFPDYSSQVK